MKSWTIWLIILVILGGIVGVSYQPISKALKERYKPKWRTQPVVRGDLTLSVNATGKVEPTKKVTIGASVSGPVKDLYVDFNAKVSQDQILARIDPRIYEATVQRDRAILQTREAEVERATAMLQQSINDEQRSQELLKVDQDYISQTEFDQIRFAKMAKEAELTVAKTNVEQARAQLENSMANLTYTEITSPVNGIIINRKVDVGQTLASQFQTPEMFIVAPDMDKLMHIYASVDEADIGLIRKAEKEGKPVHFTVDAYPDELFEEGKIVQVRISSSETQNVVTYPVIVESPNLDVKLLPGMTANLSFQIDSRSDVIKIPNAALRFYPDRKRVHPSDYKVLDGTSELQDQVSSGNAKNQSAEEKAASNKIRNKRHVWVDDGEFLRAKEVTLGISDSRFTEMLEGDLKLDEELVIGEKPKEPGSW